MCLRCRVYQTLLALHSNLITASSFRHCYGHRSGPIPAIGMAIPVSTIIHPIPTLGTEPLTGTTPARRMECCRVPSPTLEPNLSATVRPPICSPSVPSACPGHRRYLLMLDRCSGRLGMILADLHEERETNPMLQGCDLAYDATQRVVWRCTSCGLPPGSCDHHGRVLPDAAFRHLATPCNTGNSFHAALSLQQTPRGGFVCEENEHEHLAESGIEESAVATLARQGNICTTSL